MKSGRDSEVQKPDRWLMNEKQQEFVRAVLKGARSGRGARAEAFAPANIALVKYWGKRDAELNLPLTSSLSISLGARGTRTVLRPCGKGPDRIALNGEEVRREHPFAVRLTAFLDLFRTAEVPAFEVDTLNRIPTAAGLASSASGFAALVKALDDLFGWGLDARRLSLLARLGSGSAARSLYEGFAIWQAGVRSDGMDSFAEPLAVEWPGFRIGLLELCSTEKSVGSRVGMLRTAESSVFMAVWPRRVEADMERMMHAVEARDFPALGAVAEGNALAMHALMLSACPPLCYWLPESVAAMHQIWKLRAEGLPLYFTMDAGPNLKLLFLEDMESAVRSAFPAVQVIDPFSSFSA